MRSKPTTAQFKQAARGFALMETLIAVVIVAIISAIAIPTYIHYTKRSRFSEVVTTADRYKNAVASCLQRSNGVALGCNAGNSGIPPGISVPVGSVSSLDVIHGVIIGTPVPSYGILSSDTYYLLPSFSANGTVTWTVAGGACKSGLVSACSNDPIIDYYVEQVLPIAVWFDQALPAACVDGINRGIGTNCNQFQYFFVSGGQLVSSINYNQMVLILNPSGTLTIQAANGNTYEISSGGYTLNPTFTGSDGTSVEWEVSGDVCEAGLFSC